MKDDMTPEQLPMVSCIPLAVVRLPYLGELFGSYKKHQNCQSRRHVDDTRTAAEEGDNSPKQVVTRPQRTIPRRQGSIQSNEHHLKSVI